MKKVFLLCGFILLALGLWSCRSEMKVTFYRGSTNLRSFTIPAGELIVRPLYLETDSDFVGWYQEPQLVNSFDFNASLMEDTNIYGKWTSTPVDPGDSVNPDVPPIDWDTPSIFPDTDPVLQTYYAGLYGATGSTLLDEVLKLDDDILRRSYGDARFDLEIADEDPAHPGYFYVLYDTSMGLLVNNWGSGGAYNGYTVNREHVWPCSQMKIGTKDRPTNSDKGHYSDLHNLRISQAYTNGQHGNAFYGSPTGSASYVGKAAKVPGQNIYYPGNEGFDHRGDIARILFYMDFTYDRLMLIDDENTPVDLYLGRISELLAWHYADPVDEFEISRNNKIFNIQKNRNPFIDHPELVGILYHSSQPEVLASVKIEKIVCFVYVNKGDQHEAIY
jgi:hypothetical protein